MSRYSPLQIAPGIVKSDAPYALKGRWIDGDKVRFLKGQPEKWHGFESYAGPVVGIPRKMVSFDDFSLNRWIAVGTHSKLEIIKSDLSVINVTPYRATGTLANDPFAVVDTSKNVTVTHTTHLLAVGDTVKYSGATAGGGITIDGEYEVTKVFDANSYRIRHSVAATSTDATTGGAAVLFSYEISPGSTNVVLGSGYGTGRWDSGHYGTPRVGIITSARYPRMWSFAMAGEQLYAMPSGNKLYKWLPTTPTVHAVLITNSPSGLYMFMTNERFPVVLGAGDNMTLAWPDQNDHTNWTPAFTSTATIRALAYGNRLIAGTNLRTFTNLIWSDTHCYVMQYTGAQGSVYSTLPAGANCGLIGPNAFAVDSGGNAYWMSTFNFFMYAGGVQPIPNSDDIRDWLYRRLQSQQIYKVHAYYSSKYSEVRWTYVCSDFADEEPTCYVAVSLTDFSWTMGDYQRNAITEQSGANPAVYGVDVNGNIFLEDTGLDADGDALPAFIVSAPIDIDDGNQLEDMQGLIPNWERQAGNIDLTLTSWDKPQDPDPLETQNFTIEEGQGIVDMNMSGRQISVRLDTIAVGGDFRLGKLRVEIVDESQAKRR